MDEPIFPREIMRDRGADAFKVGKGSNEHHMNPAAFAIPVWQEGWDMAHGQTSPESNVAPHRRAHVDARQGEAA